MVSNHVVYTMLVVQSIVQRINQVLNMHTIHFVPATMNNYTFIRFFSTRQSIDDKLSEMIN